MLRILRMLTISAFCACLTASCRTPGSEPRLSEKARGFVLAVREDASGFQFNVHRAGYMPYREITLLTAQPPESTQHSVRITRSEAIRITQYLAGKGLLDKTDTLPYGKVVGWYCVLSDKKAGTVLRFLGLERDALLRRPDILGVRSALSSATGGTWDDFIAQVRGETPLDTNAAAQAAQMSISIREWKDHPLTMGQLMDPGAAKGAEVLNPDDEQSKAVLNMAKPIYDRLRDALIQKFHLKGSKLDYPLSAKARWRVIKSGDRLYVHTGCLDRMYVAMFTLEFQRASGKEWACTAVYGIEFFKGE